MRVLSKQILWVLRQENFRLVEVDGCARTFTDAEMMSLAPRLASADEAGRKQILDEAIQRVREESIGYQI